MNIIEVLIQQQKIFIDPESKCWLWLGSITGGGYGSYGAHEYAHRKSYEIFNGAIPKGLHVLHRCDIKRCVNPEHLYIGTRSDNMQDKLARCTYEKTNQYKYATHCKNGHEFTEENTRISSSNGQRVCRTCHRIRNEESQKRNAGN